MSSRDSDNTGSASAKWVLKKILITPFFGSVCGEAGAERGLQISPSVICSGDVGEHLLASLHSRRQEVAATPGSYCARQAAAGHATQTTLIMVRELKSKLVGCPKGKPRGSVPCIWRKKDNMHKKHLYFIIILSEGFLERKTHLK